MRFAIAGFAHETVTFLPGLTGRADFEGVFLRGDAIVDALRGSSSVAGGFIAACEEEGAAITGIVYGEAAPSGPVAETVFDACLDEVARSLKREAGRLDGLLLHLHGAMVTERRHDAESDFLAGLRGGAGPDFPIAVAMDLHGNLSPGMVALADVVCGYHESPHVDMAQTGARAARLLMAKIKGVSDPRMAVRKPALVLPSIFTATALAPLCDIMALAREREMLPDVLDISVFTGFAYADVPDIGFSVAVITDGNGDLAAEIADELTTEIESRRFELFKRELLRSPEAAVDRALAVAARSTRPVVILEHADRMNDSTHVLAALAGRSAERAAVPYLCDPVAVRAAIAAGVGNRVRTTVGGRSSAQAGAPVAVDAIVTFAGPKRYIGSGPMRRGVPVDLGDAAVLQAGGITIILTTANVSAIDLDPFDQFGFRAEDFDVILLRSKTHFRAAYEAVAAEIVVAETPDWGPADLATLPYRNVRAGVYPITR